MTKNAYIWMAFIVAITSVVTISSVAANDKAYAEAYDRSQIYSETNSCGNDLLALRALCSNTDSGVQGEDNTVALATEQGAPLISEVPDKISEVPDKVVDGFLQIKEAIIKPFGQPNPPLGQTDGGLDAFLRTHGLIPQDGEGGAFGYGILTTNTLTGDGSLTVATTHGGVLDSIEQQDISDPVWHNHMVKLVAPPNNCGTDMEVGQITWEQPGDVLINGKTAQLINIPNVFSSPSSFNPNGPDETYEPGNEVQTVVSFKLAPIPDTGGSAPDGTLDAVCVTDITEVPEENLIIK